MSNSNPNSTSDESISQEEKFSYLKLAQAYAKKKRPKTGFKFSTPKTNPTLSNSKETKDKSEDLAMPVLGTANQSSETLSKESLNLGGSPSSSSAKIQAPKVKPSSNSEDDTPSFDIKDHKVFLTKSTQSKPITGEHPDEVLEDEVEVKPRKEASYNINPVEANRAGQTKTQASEKSKKESEKHKKEKAKATPKKIEAPKVKKESLRQRIYIAQQEMIDLPPEDQAMKIAKIEASHFKEKYESSYQRHPFWFVLHQIIRPRSLINPILAVCLGAVMALSTIVDFNWIVYSVFGMTVFTAILAQIFSNLCIQYTREEVVSRFECKLSSLGLISRSTIKHFIYFVVILMSIAWVCLISLSILSPNFKDTYVLSFTLIFAGLALFTLCVLFRYSMGNNPYNFTILGELAYLLLYGILFTMVSYYLQSFSLFDSDTNIIIAILPAIGFGCCCVADLNIVNMRDAYVAVLNHKNNFASFLGVRASRVLQTFCYAIAIILYAYYDFNKAYDWWSYIYLIAIPLIVYHLYVIHKSDVTTVQLHHQTYITQTINIILTGLFIVTTALQSFQVFA